MIMCDKGEVQIVGSGKDIVEEFAFLSASLFELVPVEARDGIQEMLINGVKCAREFVGDKEPKKKGCYDSEEEMRKDIANHVIDSLLNEITRTMAKKEYYEEDKEEREESEGTYYGSNE